MRRDDIIAKLKEAKPALRAAGVGALHLFGSWARGEARPSSDVDVFVDPASDDRFRFLQFMDAYAAIQKAVGDDVEGAIYSTRAGLSPCIRAAVEQEAGSTTNDSASKKRSGASRLPVLSTPPQNLKKALQDN